MHNLVHMYMQILYILICTLRGLIASAISVIQHSLRGGTCNTARYMIMVIVLAFLTQENKMQSTINQLKHGKGHAVRNNGTHGVVSIDHIPRTIMACTAIPSRL